MGMLNHIAEGTTIQSPCSTQATSPAEPPHQDYDVSNNEAVEPPTIVIITGFSYVVVITCTRTTYIIYISLVP